MTGLHLAQYRIDAELGRGGMGIVYRATDTKLDRTVALKVLPPHALASEDDRVRFYREARSAARLNHAHIATIHQIDEAVPEGAPHGTEPRPFIAMEYVDGESLADRVARGPLKLDEAIRIASEVADALGAAHDAGIVHRDVKSGNVMLTAKGDVKVLDFGLAKTSASTQLTRQGATLGTIAYMSPEQARGEEVDRRTDLWALGVVLYEMIAGRLPFSADYEQATLYGILNEDPQPLTAVRTGVPMELEQIVFKLLRKEAKLRYQGAADLLADLGSITKALRSGSAVRSMVTSAGSISPVPPAVGGRNRYAVLLAVAVIVSVAAGYALAALATADDPTPTGHRLEIVLPAIEKAQFPVISKSTRWIAFVGRDTLGRSGLFLFETRTGRLHYTEQSGDAIEHASFSPSEDRIAFTSYGLDSGIFVSVIPGGIPQRVSPYGRVPVWLDDRTIVLLEYEQDDRPHVLDLVTGEVRILDMEGESILEDYEFYWTSRLADRRMVLGDIEPNGLGGEAGILMAFDVDTGDLTALEPGIINPYYAPTGHLVYQKGTDDGALLARPFDAERLAFTGPPTELLPHMAWQAFSVGGDGSLVYIPGLVSGTAGLMRLTLLDTENGTQRTVPLSAPSGSMVGNPAFSPVNEDQVLVDVHPMGMPGGSITLLDFRTGVASRRPYQGVRSHIAWAADGRSVYMDDPTEDQMAVYRLDLFSQGGEELVLQGAQSPAASPDGRWLALSVSEGRRAGLFLMDLDSGELVPVDTSEGAHADPDFSPDGRYVVYRSRSHRNSTYYTTGELRVAEVGGPARFTVSSRGSGEPRWSPDGRYLYFLGPEDDLFRLAVDVAPTFRIVGQPELVADVGRFTSFDPSRNGTTVAIASTRVDPVSETRSARPVTLVWWNNWMADADR